MNILEAVWGGLVNGVEGVWVLARVVIPLMILLEIAKENNILDVINDFVHPPFRWLGLSRNGAFPVMVAIVFGLTFGSGVIINYINEGRIGRHETKIIGSFMALCHALIEDTLILFVLGIPLWLLVIPRLAVAMLASFFLGRFLVGEKENYTLSAN